MNLFVQDMPRLSVGIDVVFTDHTHDREAALDGVVLRVDAGVLPNNSASGLLSVVSADREAQTLRNHCHSAPPTEAVPNAWTGAAADFAVESINDILRVTSGCPIKLHT